MTKLEINGFMILPDNCEKITELIIRKNSLSNIGLECFINIKKLSLYDCTSIDNSTLKKLNDLEELHCYGKTSITEDAIKYLVKLKILHVSFDINKSSLKYLTNLQDVKIIL